VKILVLGSTGMAGHIITLYFCRRGYDTVAFSNTPFRHCKNIIGDATDIPFMKNILEGGQYDVIINCIGILNEFAEYKKAEAVFLNSYLPHYVADFLKETKTKIIQMSTDCVFSGKLGQYSENSVKDGETFYDRSKALGELDDNKNLTFRNSIIGPDMNKSGIGLFNWFMKQKDVIEGYKTAIWTGVTTLTLAKAMEQGIKENLTGIYHLVNTESISKYDLLGLFNKYFRNNQIKIKSSNAIVSDKSLINNRTDFSFKVPDYEQMVAEMKEWVISHKELYPHYF